LGYGYGLVVEEEMIEARLRTRITEVELEQKLGKILTTADYNILITGPTRLRKPDGSLLCIYLPGGIAEQAETAYPLLTKMRGTTRRRKAASGSVMPALGPKGNIMSSMPIYSGLLGAVDPAGGKQYCRLTSFTAEHVQSWEELRPLWRLIAEQFATYVPDRYANQEREAARTRPEWVVPGTPFTTVTVNNSYSTGVHYDNGDLDEGFSCLGVLRKGNYTGGHLVFPSYRVAVDMKDGDLLLMDAHSAHGNTQMVCECGAPLPGGGGRKPPEVAKQSAQGPCTICGAERVSVVCYFRTKMVNCGSSEEEDARRMERVEAGGHKR
jgi:hypothetical protein